MDEMKSISKIAGPTALTGLILYSRAMISMLFVGYIGELELAAASLSIGFANITGYSIITGLSMGMEPICGQAFGAKRLKLLGVTLQRTLLILFLSCLPLSLLWLAMEKLLLWCGQDPRVTSMASTYITFSIPDLFAQAVFHPLRVYLRAQSITLPLMICAFMALILQVPINFLLVVHMDMGIKGAALASVWTNFNLVFFLLVYMCSWGPYKKTLRMFSPECLRGWQTLLRLAIPSCFSVCLEWWWYEFMILLCGLLPNPRPKVAAMGALIQTTSLLYIIPTSISLGASTRIGNELGANMPQKARKVMIVALWASSLLGFLSMVFAIGVRSVWGKMFSHDQETLDLTCAVLPIIGLCEIFNCPQTTGCGILRGCARPSLVANVNFISFYLLGMPVAVVLGFYLGLGFLGLWLGLLVAEVCCLFSMVYVLFQTDWIVEARRACKLTGACDGGPLILHYETDQKASEC
ncbi:protein DETOXIFICATION 48-like [Magnolia sinica]|uniref:protein DETOXIFICATION 48-like n=1 Tax=Magnolia sinica TaxID=86752 RepID=UPI002657FE91|nr:protein DETOXIFICATION 48-like [Magnolia sinica]